MIFTARIIAYDVQVGELEGGASTPAVDFAVDLTNIYDPTSTDQFELQPPFDIKVGVSVFIEQDPTRRRQVERTEHIEEVFEPGDRIRVILRLPSRDQNDYPWCWHYGRYMKRDLILQGKVTIRREFEQDIVVNTPRKSIQYYVPSP